MHTNLGNRIDGISEAGADFYVARAKGGFGLIGIGVIDAYFIEGAGSSEEFFLDNGRHVANYARLVRAIKRYGAIPYAQIGVRRLFPVKTMHRANRPTLAGFPTERIEEMIAAVVERAVLAAEAGFDAVDILGVGGSAHSIFLSQVFNDRTNSWGGTPEKRLRFTLETIRRIKTALGADFPVFYRLHGSEFLRGGYGVEQAKRNAAAMEEAGVAFFNVTGGGHATSVPQLTPNVPRDAFAFLAAEIKKAVRVPVAASNRNNRPAEAEAILRRGWANMISLGRQSLSDAEWPNKVAAGNYESIRYCIACNECMDITVIHDKPVHCLVNPRQGVVSEVDDVPTAPRRKKVLVIGGGVTGLQVALTCAERNHDVTVFERKSYLGGMWHEASFPDGREELFQFAEWLVTQSRRAGVALRLNTEATDEAIAALAPDVIVVAVGSEPVMPDIPGINLSNVMLATRALEADAEIGERVVIVGGGGIGAEIAPYLAKRWTLRPEIREFLRDYHALETKSGFFDRRGHAVTLTSRQKSIGGTVGGSTRWVVASEVEHAGVRVLAGATPKRITPNGVIIEQNGREELIEADTVLIAAGLAANTRFFDEVKAKGLASEIYSVGSAELSMHAIQSVKEAYRLGLKI